MKEHNLLKEQGNINRGSRVSGFSGFYKFLVRFRIWIIGILLGLLSLVAIGVYWISSLDIEKLVVPILAPTQLLDRNGEPSSQIISVKIDPMSIDQIPLHMQQAIVAVEDKRYYDHTGVDAFGIIRAVFRNVKEGGAAQGGSTITQQLAKNVFFNG